MEKHNINRFVALVTNRPHNSSAVNLAYIVLAYCIALCLCSKSTVSSISGITTNTMDNDKIRERSTYFSLVFA